MAGKVVTASDFRMPQLATADLAGRTIREVMARGKHLFWRFGDATSLHTHFLMQGSWHLYRPGARWRGPAHEVRLVIEVDDRVAVGFRRPVVELLPTTEEARIVAHLGPDPLGPDWDAAEAERRLRAAADQPVADVLLDQRVIAGLGNVYKSEICFLRGLWPWTPVADVAEPGRLVALAKRLMEVNRTTGNQVTTGSTRPDEARWVYGRGGRPCRRCGSPIERRAEHDERVTYWCPRCQPAPAAAGGLG